MTTSRCIEKENMVPAYNAASVSLRKKLLLTFAVTVDEGRRYLYKIQQPPKAKHCVILLYEIYKTVRC